MKAVMFIEKNSVEIKEVPTPIPKHGEVLIAIKAAGLCVTDVHIINGQFNLVQPPCILGHEIAGKIIGLGNGVDGKLLHKRVIIEPTIACGYCKYCQSGAIDLCLNAHEIGFPPLQGGYAEFICVPWQNVHQIPDELPFSEAAILESFIGPVGAAMRVGISQDSVVFVQGLGPAGLAFVQVARLLGAKQIIVSDGNPQKLALAELYGAEVCINYRTENVNEKLGIVTKKSGIDIVFEASANPHAIQGIIDYMALHGKIIAYGLLVDGVHIDLDYNAIILKKLQIFGSSGASWAWEPVLGYIRSGQFSVSAMISKTFPLGAFKQGVTYLTEHHEAIKVVFTI